MLTKGAAGVVFAVTDAVTTTPMLSDVITRLHDLDVD